MNEFLLALTTLQGDLIESGELKLKYEELNKSLKAQGYELVKNNSGVIFKSVGEEVAIEFKSKDEDTIYKITLKAVNEFVINKVGEVEVVE